jgi:hypothetical protein
MKDGFIPHTTVTINYLLDGNFVSLWITLLIIVLFSLPSTTKRSLLHLCIHIWTHTAALLHLNSHLTAHLQCTVLHSLAHTLLTRSQLAALPFSILPYQKGRSPSTLFEHTSWDGWHNHNWLWEAWGGFEALSWYHSWCVCDNNMSTITMY